MAKADDWFERIWTAREETLYPSLFGASASGIYTIPMQRLEHGKVADPRWLTCGVFRFAPTPQRDSWLFVTSGLSNEWFEEKPNPDGISGFGCEFILETTTDAEWPIHRLHQLMVYQIGLCVGRYPDHEPLTAGYRVPLGDPIDFAASPLTFVLLAEPPRFPTELQQESGRAELIQVVGISEREKEYGKANGHEALVEWLQQHTPYPVCDPQRNAMEP